jgi:hypothetical protein
MKAGGAVSDDLRQRVAVAKLKQAPPGGHGHSYEGFGLNVLQAASFPLRLQPICNCLGLIFLKITCICLARERTAVSVRFIRMPIAVELSPVSANLRSVSSSVCVHGRETKCSGSVIGPRALQLKANHGLPPARSGQGICPSNRRRRSRA